MENFCTQGKIEHKEGYDVCRGENFRNGLRYDLTLIYPGFQTKGHYHLNDEPEIYQVISGVAFFLIQNRERSQTYLIEAKEGEKIIFPPGFSMRTINPSKEKNLIISNWVGNDVKNDYNAFENLNEIQKLKPKKIPEELENLDFLTNPEKYKNLLTIENLYEKIT